MKLATNYLWKYRERNGYAKDIPRTMVDDSSISKIRNPEESRLERKY